MQFKMPAFNMPSFGAQPKSGGANVKTVAVSGSSGLVGTALATALVAQNVKVVRLGRDGVDPALLEGVDAVVHLAGENVATGSGPLGFIGIQAWSEDKKAEIIRSRVEGTTELVEAMKKCGSKGPKTLVCASGVGYYGFDTADALCDESSPMGSGFLAQEVVPAWESAANLAPGRVVNARLGVVLSSKGGALSKLLPIFLLGGGGVLGSGKQYFSWVSLADVVKGIIFLLNTPSIKGPVNVCAPEPVTNADFTTALGRVVSRPTLLPFPEVAVQLLFGQMGQEMLLGGQRAVPRKLLASGFEFTHPSIESGIRAALE